MVPQIKDNYLFPLQEHTFGSLLTQITPATPFVVGILLTIGWMLLSCCVRFICCKKDVSEMKVEDLVVIEGLDPFFSSLKSGDREFWFREEVVA